ncbi:MULTISPECIES: polyprenyl synthetase family protein [unclassified Marinobacterium]|jgi:octaprenyl-diphosphate synthase|uniref:polyprenyl synthetase family protein n=1 Tax=unclassified Marinobacterium TaxID=2644139 RepID=UPI001568C119|nr:MULTISPECIES: polyprenyl synthetase family protein [unclassified Marinobacterium]NRP26647.1 Octaprenyl-diphosphate synthase [Marinobacterium sp. xm-d-420]NRP35608.1 Octaprenyl-diphosphate synthase [Marinobacterium sp. xm-d-579]NRP37654.1 Octaprenyl-diphosphate synthase [Marinobacterium sp. xm-a-121]NRP52928.1 Octaprenyl-diphosphate synthase [Marinobacterium sp. xm-v-242]NRP56522.1 Octaprenyl-diphosphate synthase [Marinobacterium sp. xm-d-510]
MQPHQLNPLIEPQFDAVTDYILNNLGSNVPLVEKIAHHIVEGGGKRLRPLLVLLAANAAGYKGEQHIPLAAVIEFIHTATLLHDDVVDNSELRRGNATANAQWGNAPSVLVGDFLYSRSFQIMVEIGRMEIMQVISHATTIIAEGEVLQLLNQRNPDTSEESYLQVILGKTAMLFEAATEVGAILADSSAENREALRLYGRHLGIAFQIVDDLLDYLSDSETMGKNVGDDLAEGKATLPLIHAMRVGSDEDRELIRQAIRKGGLDDLSPVLEIVQRNGSIDYSRQKAAEEIDKAKNAIASLPDTSFKVTLNQIADLAIARTQ